MARILLVKAANLLPHTDAMVPPLGIMYLAAVLRKSGRHEVRILDARLSASPGTALTRALTEFEPDLLGISAITTERRSLSQLSKLARALRPRMPIVIGGPHPTALPRTALEQSGADAAVVGEAEEVTLPLVESLLDGGGGLGIEGVMTGVGTEGDDGAAHAKPPDMDSLPLPAWDLVRLEDYFQHRSMTALSPWRYGVISTSRGCPFRCRYCHNVHGRIYRPRALEHILEELNLLGGLVGRGAVEILDDGFNIDTDRAKSILELFCRTDGRLRPSFPNGVRSDRLPDDLLDMMVESKTAYLSFAIETASTRLQAEVGKRLDLEAAKDAIGKAARRGIYTNGFFMLGFPSEKLGEMLSTLKFSRSVPLDQAEFFRVLPLPGTAFWPADPEIRGRIEAELDGDYFFSSVNLSDVPDRQFDALYRLAYLGFYGRPTKLLRLGARYPNKRELFRRAVQTLSIVFQRSRDGR